MIHVYQKHTVRWMHTNVNVNMDMQDPILKFLLHIHVDKWLEHIFFSCSKKVSLFPQLQWYMYAVLTCVHCTNLCTLH